MIDPLYAIAGFSVGMLVGMTGVGGGSLMTPLLILLFGIHPATAVGTDLLYAAATKTGGTLIHGITRGVDWRIVARLASGSLPATIVTLYLLSLMDLNAAAARDLITIVLSGALAVTAAVLFLRNRIISGYRIHLAGLGSRKTTAATVLTGALVGVLVSISSVGAGAIGTVALLILYPKLPVIRIVGTDIAHAVALTLVAGMGHWMIGTVDWPVVGSLLAGSLPGVFLGSFMAARLPESALRLLLAGTLLLVAGKLAVDHIDKSALITTALTGRATN